jgi:hypothetical protein
VVDSTQHTPSNKKEKDKFCGEISKVTAGATDKFKTHLSTIPNILNVGNTDPNTTLSIATVGNTDPNTVLSIVNVGNTIQKQYFLKN